MFQSPCQDAIASTVLGATVLDAIVLDAPRPTSPFPHAPATTPSSPPPAAECEAESETVRHMIFGSLNAVRGTMMRLYQLNYAEPHEWSRPMPTGRPNEVMVILTKKVRLRK